MTTPIPRPAKGEYNDYYHRYIERVPDGDLVAQLAKQRDATRALLGGLSEERGRHRYAPDKWTVTEVVGHLADAERIFAYRMLRIARKDTTAMSSFDENAYVPAGQFAERKLADVLAEFMAVREGTLALLRGLPADAPARVGTASGKSISARALAWIIAGHELHHLAVLKERYGVG